MNKNQKTNTKKLKKIYKFEKVPEEIYHLIMSFLPIHILLKARLISKEWLKHSKTVKIKINTEFVEYRSLSKNILLFNHLLLENFSQQVVSLYGKFFIYKDDYKHLSNLEILDIFQMNIDDCNIIADFCPKLRVFKTWDILSIKPTKIFQKCKELKEISLISETYDVSTYEIDDMDILSLVENNNGHLEVFEMNAIPFPNISEEVLMKFIDRFQNLKSLTLQFCDCYSKEWKSSPFSNEFYKRILSLPKIESISLNVELRQYIFNYNSKNILWYDS